MGLLIDDATLEILRHGDEISQDDSWIDELVDLYNDEDFLAHHGVAHDENPPGRGSGRYPFGSGDRMLQRNWDLYSRYRKLKASGMSETDIARDMGYYQEDKNGKPIIDPKTGEPKVSTSKLRAQTTIAKNYVRQEGYVKEIAKYDSRLDPDTGKPYTNTKIAQLLDINESSVRNYRNSDQASANASKPEQAANILRERMKECDYIDVGRGAELSLGVSPEGLKVALEILKNDGYQVAPVWVDQVGGTMGNKTIINTLYKPGTDYSEVFKNRDKIKPVEDVQGDSTNTLLGMRDPVRVDLDRIAIKYKDEGGDLKDGVIEIRPGVADLDLGNAKYAQVRIAVDASKELKNGERYIKGMAVYSDDLPEDKDILVNSNKKDLDSALKEMKQLKDRNNNQIGVDPDNPFGATVYQHEYIDSQGNSKLSAINIVGDVRGVDQHKEGAWDEWSRNLPAQFLSKQSEGLIKQQLKLKVQEKEAEFDEIMQLNNPVVKRQLLKDFADGCDAAAVDLKAAPLPGQRVQVILPLTTIKDNEVYAPNYDNGQTLALIRYPHTGPFEIPIVKVNNNNREAKKFMADAKDAIGMNKKTAQILSGADFDGDTVTVIPMTRKNAQGEFEKTVNIKGLGNGQAKLPGLDGFDPSEAWPGTLEDGKTPRPGVKLMDKRTKGIEMGVVSNLITDMSLKGCDNEDELARAVKYSMVVIDAEKHKLDYKAAEKYYNIKELKDKYQSNKDGSHGTSTIVSRAGSEDRNVIQRQAWVPSKQSINPETGEKIYKLAPHRFYDTKKTVKVIDPETGKPIKIGEETYVDSKGKTRKRSIYKTEEITVTNERKQGVARMDTVKDAYELLSDNPSNKEYLYADYANKMKSLGNRARKEWLATPKLEFNPAAKKKYQKEVDELNNAYIKAKKNAPRERQAQLLATQIINSRLQDNPNLKDDKEEFKRLKGQALNGARQRTGAQKERIKFTDKQWEAINAGAVSETRLAEMLKNADPDNYRALATPRTNRISASTALRIQGLLNAGWTRKEIENAGYASMDTIMKVANGTWT